MININGMAHVFLTVSRFGVARAFYKQLMPALGLECVFDGQDMCYFVGGRTAIGLQAGKPEYMGERFEQGRVGLHHLCLRARSREDVDTVEKLLEEIGATVITAAQEGPWAPGYYYVLFEDPDGIRLEVNHVPGQGVLAEGVRFDPANDWKR